MQRLIEGRAVSVRNLSVTLGGRTVLDDVSLDLRWGEATALTGRNGSGKTTLLRAVAGLVPGSGVILTGGRPDGGPARLAHVPQQLGFDPAFPITVGRLVATGLRARLGPWRRAGRTDRAAVTAALIRVGLPGAASRAVGELSGGELQRAVLARALVQGADVLLLDEPTSAVDEAGRDDLVGLLVRLCAEGRSALVSTHDLDLAATAFPRRLTLEAGRLGPDTGSSRAAAPAPGLAGRAVLAVR
jgi:zinc/manganese transport system ATP-binding protein